MVAAVAGLLLGLYAFSFKAFIVVPDELRYMRAAIQIAGTGHFLTPGDPWFNSWSQLLPAVVALPLWILHSTTAAVAWAHVLLALAFASTALPAWMLAAELGAPRRAALVASCLTVAVPWAAMSGALLTEPLAYPLFTWFALVSVRAAARGGWRWDVIALLLCGAAFLVRPQMVICVPLLALTIVLSGGLRRRVLDEHVLLWVILALGAILYLTGAVRPGDVLTSASQVLGHGGAPPFSFSRAAKTLAYVMVAVGVLPFVIGAAFEARLLRTAGRSAAQRAFAVLVLLAAIGFVFQSGLTSEQVSDRITDRYLIYVLPLTMVCAALALERLATLRRELLVASALGAALLASFDFADTGNVILSPSFALHRFYVVDAARTWSALHLPQLGAGPLLAIYAGLLLLGVLLAPARLGAARAALVVGAVAVALSSVLTVVSLWHLHGAAEPAPPDVGWIDHAAGGHARVAMLAGPLDPRIAAQSYAGLQTATRIWNDAPFWNRSVHASYSLSHARPYHLEQAQSLRLNRRTGSLGAPFSLWLVSSNEPRFGLAGLTLAHSRGIALVRTGPRPHAVWVLRGGDELGYLTVAASRATLHLIGPAARIRISFALAAGRHALVQIASAARTTRLQLDEARVGTAELPIAGRDVRLSLVHPARAVAVQLMRVALLRSR